LFSRRDAEAQRKASDRIELGRQNCIQSVHPTLLYRFSVQISSRSPRLCASARVIFSGSFSFDIPRGMMTGYYWRRTSRPTNCLSPFAPNAYSFYFPLLSLFCLRAIYIPTNRAKIPIPTTK
jgi:hypothetical protein